MASNKELQDMANVLRRDVSKMTTAAGSGHPTSCFSIAEIMSTLFFDEMAYDTKNPNNCDNDEFILSKGHAAPILYASLNRAGCIKHNLMKLRKLTSPLEGHPVPRSLSWIKVATGSLGQGLSVGAGMAMAAKMQKRKFMTYVIMGDSEVAEGSVYEALEIAAHYKLKNLVAIVDVNRLGQTGETLLGHNIISYRQRFRGFGCNVITIDGHNIQQIKSALANARKSKKPTVILAKTLKGKGVSFLENKEDWHGKTMKKDELDLALTEIPNPKVPKIRIPRPKSTRFKFSIKPFTPNQYELGAEVATREAYGKALAKLAEKNSSVIATDGEVSNSTKAGEVKKLTPDQFIEGFIAEQNLVGMSLGLSKMGFNVFASSFAAFLSRAHDQIRMAAVSSGSFTLSGSHAGVSIGEDGASQMGLEDIGMMRSLPDSIVLYPSDAVSTEKLIQLSSKLKKGIRYIRTTRSQTPVLYKNTENFPIGNFKTLFQSKKDKLVVAGSGITTHEAIKAYHELKKKGINVSVVDLYCIKPFNARKFKKFVKKHGKKLIIVEDHYKEGGIGEMLAESLENSDIKIKHLAVSEIPHSGTQEQLLDKYKINWKAIVEEAKKI